MSKKRKKRQDDQDFITRQSGLMVSELPADEWEEMHAIISLMEGEKRADFVMKDCKRLDA